MPIKLCIICRKLALIGEVSDYCSHCWAAITKPVMPEILESYNPVVNNPVVEIKPARKRLGLAKQSVSRETNKAISPIPDIDLNSS